MTMKAEIEPDDLTAKEIVNSWNEKDLADVIWKYGEERFSRRIAQNIARRREVKEIETTLELVDAIRESVPSFYRNSRKINCATRTFQALRIAVNDELGALKDGMGKAWNFLERDGRLAVISFQGLEDKTVKEVFKENVKAGAIKLAVKGTIRPSWEEQRTNPRSRSAKMKVAQKV